MAYPDYEKKFTLTTDASNVALGAVLSQQGHPVCFASRTLNEHELHYFTTEKELLGIVWATKYFRPYLYGRKFVINSDHRPLQWLHNLKEPNSKLQRWKWKLNEFDFDIKYIPGNENHVADALSRVELKECYFGDDSSNIATIHSAMEDSESHIPISLRPINVFKRQLRLVKSNENTLHSENIFKNSVTTINYIDLTIDKIKDIIKKFLIGKSVTIFMPIDKDFVKFQDVFKTLINNRRHKILLATKELQNVRDFTDFKTKILEIHLEGLHQGIEKIANRFKSQYFYPNYLKEITKIVNECELCNRCKYDHINLKLPLKITPPVYEIREKFVIDFWEWGKNIILHVLICIQNLEPLKKS